MTIASCLVVPEGVVFGVDSTTSANIESGIHYLNYNQKLFEVGEKSTFAVMTWGLSSFQDVSYRTMIANLASQFKDAPPESVQQAANAWSQRVWDTYNEKFEEEIARIREIEALQAERARAGSDKKSTEEDAEYKEYLRDLRVGFCLGGYCESNRAPEAYWFEVLPTQRSPSHCVRVESEGFWGQPNLFLRLYDGFEFNSRKRILESPFWKGSAEDLDAVLDKEILIPPHMTIRDAIDFVHFSIYATIKALKFSANDQVCGGPIELAVITTDRKFRWVKHKSWDSAISS